MKVTEQNFMEGPIPGQSLTDTPGNYPWEKPPQMADVGDVAEYYLKKLGDPEVLDDLSVIFDNNAPLAPFVKTLMTTGVMNGLHTVDASVLVSPVVHAFIKASMTEYGIKVRDDVLSLKEKANEREDKRLQMAIDLAVSRQSSSEEEEDPGIALLQELQNSGDSVEQEPMQESMQETMQEPVQEMQPEMEEVMQQEPQGAGLMSKEEQL